MLAMPPPLLAMLIVPVTSHRAGDQHKESHMLTVIQLVQSWVSARTSDTERGATMVEYGLLISLIALAVIGVVATLGGEINGLFQEVVDGI
jgi:pilus assembly protein Flp/PilA